MHKMFFLEKRGVMNMLLKRTRFSLSALCLFFITISLKAQGIEFLSLEDAVAKALHQNNQVLAGNYALKKAKWDKRQAWAMLMPSVSFNTRYSWIDKETYQLRDFFRQNINLFFPNIPPDVKIPQTVFQESYYSSFDVNLTLFNGAVWNGISYASAAKNLASSQSKSTQSATVFQVISAYLNALYARETLDLQRAYLNLSELNFKKAQRLQEAGRYSKVETLRWKVEFQQQKSIVSQSASGLRSALVGLARITAMPMDKEIKTEERLPEKLLQESKRLQSLADTSLLKMIELDEPQLLRANAALAAVKSSEEMSRLMHRNSYSKFLPNINLNYTYAWQENNTAALDDYSPKTLMVNLSWPLFSGFQDYSEAKSSYYDYQRNKEQFKDQLRNLHFTLTQTVNKLIDLKTQIELSAANVEYSSNNYAIVSKQKEKGLVSNIDFIDAKLNMQNAKSGELKNRYDFISAMVELYYLLGKLEILL